MEALTLFHQNFAVAIRKLESDIHAAREQDEARRLAKREPSTP